MIVTIYGKSDCILCKNILKKFEVFTRLWNVDIATKLTLKNVDNAETLVDAIKQGCFDFPCTVIKKDNGEEVLKKSGAILSSDIKKYFI